MVPFVSWLFMAHMCIESYKSTEMCHVYPYFRLKKIVSFSAISKNCEKRLLTSSCLSVRQPAWDNSAPTERVFMKFYN